ncbi:hypothetical protein TNCT_353111 [Trichonephila clavata]|uniref:Uncharacterized protein n=1 Tax=Trichonephila clavata TaxID=2740835 RepID=A0A8X6J4R5_TRICU|nr:hypothetical protein TNCT_353111 [Trichonephila clavata]
MADDNFLTGEYGFGNRHSKFPCSLQSGRRNILCHHDTINNGDSDDVNDVRTSILLGRERRSHLSRRVAVNVWQESPTSGCGVHHSHLVLRLHCFIDCYW